MRARKLRDTTVGHATMEELELAAEILSKADGGVVTFDDDFRIACRWGAARLTSLKWERKRENAV